MPTQAASCRRSTQRWHEELTAIFQSQGKKKTWIWISSPKPRAESPWWEIVSLLFSEKCNDASGVLIFVFLFPIYLCLRKSLQCSLNPPQRMFSILDLDVSVNIHCCVVHYFPLYPDLFNYVLGIQSNRCTHVLTFGNLNKMTQQAFSLKCIMYRYWSV